MDLGQYSDNVDKHYPLVSNEEDSIVGPKGKFALSYSSPLSPEGECGRGKG